MNPSSRPVTGKPKLILLVDDNPEDQYLTAEALKTVGRANEFRALDSGTQLLAYLRREGTYAADGVAPRPDLVLLDLNMPRMTGHETLTELREIDEYLDLPVIIFSTSQADNDVREAYRNGANSYIAKPDSFDDLCEAMDSVQRYWFDTAERARR